MSLANNFSGYLYPSSFKVSTETNGIIGENMPNLEDNTRFLKKPLQNQIKKSLLGRSIIASDEMIEFICQNYSNLLSIGKVNYIKGSYYFSMESFDILQKTNKIYIVLDFCQPNAKNGLDVSEWIWVIMKNNEFMCFSKNDLVSYLYALKI